MSVVALASARGQIVDKMIFVVVVDVVKADLCW